MTAIPLHLVKKHRSTWNKDTYKELFARYDAKFRIYFPFQLPETNNSAPEELKNELQKLNFTVDDYIGGYASKDGRKFSLGKVLRRLEDQSHYQRFVNDPLRQGTNIKDFLIVISRHPLDIIYMSTNRGWTSCMDYHGESLSRRRWKQRMFREITNKTLVAYLIRKEDTKIKNPICRIVIKPYFKNKDREILWSGWEVYGSNVNGFEEQVLQIVHQFNSDTGGFYFRNKRISDNDRAETGIPQLVLTGNIVDEKQLSSIIPRISKKDEDRIYFGRFMGMMMRKGYAPSDKITEKLKKYKVDVVMPSDTIVVEQSLRRC